MNKLLATCQNGPGPGPCLRKRYASCTTALIALRRQTLTWFSLLDIKLQDFANFWTAIKKSEFVKGASEETDIVKWTFKDGTVLEVKQEEHSVRYNTGDIALHRS